jgi:hypothetical protein
MLGFNEPAYYQGGTFKKILSRGRSGAMPYFVHFEKYMTWYIHDLGE